MEADAQAGEVVKAEDVERALERPEEARFDLSRVEDPTSGLKQAEKLVQYMADKCEGPEYIAKIQNKDYPKVDWWTTVGGALGLFPQEEDCRKLDREGETAYEATVGVYNGDQRVTRASAICSSAESTWENRDEYAIRSMAITRATGKAYRIGLSFLAVMADLEPTPAEEMPRDGGQEATGPVLERTVPRGKHKGTTWGELVEEDPGYVEWALGETDWLDGEDAVTVREAMAGPDNGDADPPEAEDSQIKQLRAALWQQFGRFFAAEDVRTQYIRAFAQHYEDYPDSTDDWTVAHYQDAIDLLEKEGQDPLEHLKPEPDTDDTKDGSD